MKILVIADEPDKSLWDYYDESKLKGLDLILSAGDLPPAYLSFLVTFSNCPLLYVHGNHDDVYEKKNPDGCVCIDDRVYVHEGVRIFGLGGSMRYKPGTWQFTEKEMQKRVRKASFQLWKNHGFDILLTHAPLQGYGDQSDFAHRGFASFKPLLDKYQPRFMVHGHVHMNYAAFIPRTIQYSENTTIVNAYKRYTIEV